MQCGRRVSERRISPKGQRVRQHNSRTTNVPKWQMAGSQYRYIQLSHTLALALNALIIFYAPKNMQNICLRCLPNKRFYLTRISWKFGKVKWVNHPSSNGAFLLKIIKFVIFSGSSD